jgi:hypothetical protein
MNAANHSQAPATHPAPVSQRYLANRGRPVRQRDSKVNATSVGLCFPERMLEFDDWQVTGARIARMASSSAWYLGDWLIYGEAHYADRYRHAVETVGLNYQTLRNYAWVARRFPLSRRRDKLSFNHHMEVAKLSVDDQDWWLDRAVKQGWSVQELRRRLKQKHEGVEQNGRSQRVVPKINADEDRLERWHAAARQASTTFDYWVVASLDYAADRILDESEADPHATTL